MVSKADHSVRRSERRPAGGSRQPTEGAGSCGARRADQTETITVVTVGQPLPMIDAQARVSGGINYVLNIELARMLSGKILRSPLTHARVVKVDGSRAERLAGAGAVLTRGDFTGPTGF